MDESIHPKSAVRSATREKQNADRTRKSLMKMSAAACELVFVRHGETNWNVEKRLQGHTDPQPALSSIGKQQAEQLSKHLINFDFDAIYSSDLSRAVDTAMILCKSKPKLAKLTTMFGLRERCLGVLEGLTMEEARLQHPDLVVKLAKASSDFPLTSRIEPHNDFSQRVLTTVLDIASKHPKGKVLVVTHGGVLRTISQVAGQWTRSSKIENCSVYTAHIDCSCKPPLLALTNLNVAGGLDTSPKASTSDNDVYG